MKKRDALVLGMLFLAVTGTILTVACGPTPAPKVLKIRVAYPSEVAFGDVPSLMAWDKLADKGYAVLPIFFAAPELSTEAVSRGDAEIGTGATRTTFSAIAKGAKIKLIVDESANEWSVVAGKSIKECKDLDGKRVAIHSEGAISTMMLKTWVDTNAMGPNRTT